MNTGRFIRQGQPLPPCDRLYFGHPSCPAFLWNENPAPDTDRPLTVVLPPISQRHVQARNRFVEMLAQREPPAQLEISAGDFGTLCFLSRFRAANALPWALTAGPLIGYQDTDPAIARFVTPSEKRTPVWVDGQPAELYWQAPSADLVSHWATPQVFSDLALLRDLGVTRLELCAQPLPWRAEGIGMPITVYTAAFLSVFPCREICPCCGDGAVGGRDGRVLRRDQNLLYYACDVRGDGVDRLVAFP
jgi:hypothetical protein